MVVTHILGDILVGKSFDYDLLNLPVPKPCPLKLDILKVDEIQTVYNCQPPILPFASSSLLNVDLSAHRRLTAKDVKCKAVYEICLDVKDSRWKFRAGDTIGVLPQNREEEVNFIVNRLNVDADSQYTISIDNARKGARIPSHIPVKSTIRHVLTNCVDIRAIMKKLFLLALSRYTKDEQERKILEYICSKQGSELYTIHVLNKHLCVVDVLANFQSCNPPIEVVLEYLPRLLPRPYSIINSSSENSETVKICFSVVNLPNKRKGITTGWLEDIILKRDETGIEKEMRQLSVTKESKQKISIYLRNNVNDFFLPQNIDNPLIMVGSGTGVAPFLGFLDEREKLRNSSPSTNLGEAYLFFGCRDPKLDFIYEKELCTFVAKGTLNKIYTAFSRGYDNNGIKYVQDSIQQNGIELVNCLQNGAKIFVCGDQKRMASGVEEIIVQCLEQHGQKSKEEAQQYIINMKKEKRYIIDIWS